MDSKNLIFISVKWQIGLEYPICLLQGFLLCNLSQIVDISNLENNIFVLGGDFVILIIKSIKEKTNISNSVPYAESHLPNLDLISDLFAVSDFLRNVMLNNHFGIFWPNTRKVVSHCVLPMVHK